MMIYNMYLHKNQRFHLSLHYACCSCLHLVISQMTQTIEIESSIQIKCFTHEQQRENQVFFLFFFLKKDLPDGTIHRQSICSKSVKRNIALGLNERVSSFTISMFSYPASLIEFGLLLTKKRENRREI